MTKFAFEVPLAHLEDFDQYQDLIFALSFLCEDPHYVKYIERNRKGRTLIIDNSYNELGIPDSSDEMARLFCELNADFVICPDSDSWNLEQLRNTYRKMISLVPREKVLVVVKSKEEGDMFFNEGAFYYCTTYEQRKKLPESVKNLCYHFLGLIDPWEIKRYSPISCDTSMPIKLALQGRTILDWIKDGCPHLKTTPDFFNLTLTKEQLKLALENTAWTHNNLTRVNYVP